MKKVVIFDLDGTLLYSLDDLMDSVNYTLDLFGYQNRTLEEITSFVGNGVKYLLKLSLPADISEDEMEKCFAIFKDHYSEHCCDKTHPYDGIIDMMKALKDKGLKVCIVSNKFQSAAEEVCDFYFKGLYDMVIGESETCRRKPAPDGINMICESYGVEKEDVLFFGDSEVDVKTAENAGVFGVSVLWGYRDKQFLAENGAKLFIQTPEEILYMVE